MSSGSGGATVIVDKDGGDAVTVTDSRLDVNAYLNATPTIDIGDVSLLLGGTAADTNTGVVGAQTLRVTMAANDSLLTAMNTNLIDIEALLTTIDADTGNLTGINGAIIQHGVGFGGTGNVLGMVVVRNDELAILPGAVADGDNTYLQ